MQLMVKWKLLTRPPRSKCTRRRFVKSSHDIPRTAYAHANTSAVHADRSADAWCLMMMMTTTLTTIVFSSSASTSHYWASAAEWWHRDERYDVDKTERDASSEEMVKQLGIVSTLLALLLLLLLLQHSKQHSTRCLRWTKERKNARTDAHRRVGGR